VAARKKRTQPKAAKKSGLFNDVLSSKRKGKKRQIELRVIESRLRMAEGHHEPFWYEFQRNEEFYVGKQLGHGNWMDDWAFDDIHAMARSGRVLIVNRILAALAAQNSSIMWRIPHFNLRARKPGGPQRDRARLAAESTLNYVLQSPRNNFLQNARLMLLMAEMGYGVMKATYTPDEGIDPDIRKDEELGELVVEQGPEGVIVEFMGGQPKLDDKGRPIRRGGNKFVVDNRNPADWFRSDWVHYSDMRHDPEGANNLADHSWVAQRMSWSFNDFMDNSLFTHKQEIQEVAVFMDREGLTRKTRNRLEPHGGRTLKTESVTGFDPNQQDKDLMRIWGYQFWDIKNRMVYYTVDGFEKIIAKVPYPKWIDVSPYSIAKFHEVPGEFFPIPEVTAARPLAMAYNEMQSMLLTHTRRFGRKYVQRKGALSAKEREKFKDPDDGVVIELERGDPNSAIAPVKDAPLDVAIYRNLDRYIQDMSEILGSSPEARGVADSDTATQAAIIEQRGTSRDNDKRALVGAALEHHSKLVLDCLQENLDIPMSLQIEGPDGQTFSSRKLSRVQIHGDFDVKVDLTELEPHDIRQEKQDLTTLLQMMGPQFAFLSPTFTKRFFTAWRWNDPQLATEFQMIAEKMVEAGVQQGQGEEPGGPKPTGQGQEQGRTTQGRSIGRTARETAPSGNGSKS
jgi:hypothetical protein